jgi:hypothetical protein
VVPGDIISMHKTQHDMIIFLLFAMLFSGLTYFPIKQTFAQPQASAPTTSTQVQPSQSQQPGQFQDRIEGGRELSLLPSAQPPTPQAAVAAPTSNQQKLQVSFTSIKINNDHDPNIVGQNDGEWKIGMLVNGQFRDLSPPGSPLGDARGGRTYSLSNIQPVVLNVDKSNGALVISTIGQELDGCNFNFKIPPIMVQAGNAVANYYTGGKSSAAGTALTSLLGKGDTSSAVGNTSGATGLSGLLGKARTYLPSDYNNDPRATYPLYQYQLQALQAGINKVCNIFNANDAIGTISDTYGRPTFGVGQHSTLSTPVSDSGRDFVLTYQIKPVQQPLQSQVQQQSSQVQQQSSQFQQPSNPNVRDHRTNPSSPQ